MNTRLLKKPFVLATTIACAFGLTSGWLSPQASASENLIINGGFETASFYGWTFIPAGSDSDIHITTDFAHSGLYSVQFGATGVDFDTLSQRVPTFNRPLLKGEYQISFWIKSGESDNPKHFQALWNGRVIFDWQNGSATGFQRFVFNEKATGNSAELTFRGLNPPDWYYLDDVSVTQTKLDQASFEKYAEQAGLTKNQRSVAAAIDSAVPNRKSAALVNFLDFSSLGELPADFDRIAPEELTSIFAIGTSLANVQSQNIQRRTDDIRSGSAGFSAAGLALNGISPSYSGSFRTGVAGPNGNELRGDGKDAKATKDVVAPAENRWGVFLSGTGEWVSVGTTDNARGYDLTSGGFTLGVDYKVTPNFAIGLAAGYTGTTADLTDRGRVWVNGGKIGLYATCFQNAQVAAAPTMSKDSSKDSKEVQSPAVSIAKGFYADVAVFGGYNSYDTRRSALLGEARGDTDGGELNVLFGAGYDFKSGGFTFGPTASFNYTYIGTNEFTEHGSLVPLDIHGGKGESLRTAFGLKASYDWKVGGVLIKPEIRAAWQHEFGDAAYALDSSFANGASDTFLVNGPQIGRDSALLGAGFAIQFNERFATYFYYDGELGRRAYESNAVTGGVRFAF